MQLVSVLALASAATAATVPQRRAASAYSLSAPDGTQFELDESVVNSAAYKPFVSSKKIMPQGKQPERRGDPRPEYPAADRNATVPPYVFTLMCLEDGFRGDCTSFGAAPGVCTSFRDFDQGSDTSLSDKYDNAVVSLSTNTLGACQFYTYAAPPSWPHLHDEYTDRRTSFLHCNNKGDDRGISLSYDYDLSIPLPSQPDTYHYFKNISSWRC